MKPLSSPLKVHVFPGVFGLPSGSPFCVKLETWLRMAGLPYDQVIIEREPKSKTKKAPYVEYEDGTFLADSQVIIEALEERHQIDIDGHLSELERAQSCMIRRTIEEALYFNMFWRRWAEDEGWEATNKAFFARLPWPLSTFLPSLIRRGSLKSLHSQGTGRLDPETIIAAGVADIRAISAILGTKDFLFGSEPSSVDASFHAMIGAIATFPVVGQMERAVRDDERLMAYIERMDRRYWNEA